MAKKNNDPYLKKYDTNNPYESLLLWKERGGEEDLRRRFRDELVAKRDNALVSGEQDVEDDFNGNEALRRLSQRDIMSTIREIESAKGGYSHVLNPGMFSPEGEVVYEGLKRDDFGTRRDRGWGLIDDEGRYKGYVRDNLYNYRGEMQSGLGKISNGVVKAVTTTATTIGRTAGMVWGIPSALINWDAAEMFNNDITKAMDAVDEAMERWLPTYRSFKEENGNWWERNMSAAGISDFIKNWGFTIGSVITGNIAGLAMNGVRKAALKKMVPLLVSTMGEASMEAAQVMNDMMEPAMDVENTRYQAELADIASKYKNNPEYGPEVYDQLILEANDRHQKELDRIYDRSRAAGLWTMGLNNVVLSISNNMLFGAVLKGDAPLERVLQNGINRRFKRLVGDDMRRAITDEEKKKLIGGGAKRLLGAIKTGFSEGGEELSQKYISNAFTNYYNSVLGEDIGRILTEKKEGGGEFDDIINDYYGSMYDDGSVKEADGLWRSLWMTLGETLTDKQSWDEFTAGAAMGLLGMPTFGRRANSGASTWIGRGGVVGWSGGVAGNIRENRMEAARNSAIISQYNEFVNTYRKGPKGDQLDDAIRHIVGGITSDRKSEAMLDLLRNAGTLTQEQDGAIRNEYDRQMHEVISHAVAAYQSVGMLKQLKASVDDMMDDPAGFASDIYANAIVEEDDGNGGKVKRNIYDDITWKGKNGKSVSGQDALTELVRDRATELHNEIEFFEKVRGHLDEKYGHIMSDKSLRDMTFLYSQVHFMEGNSLDEIDRMVDGGRLADVMRTASSHSMTKLQDELKKANDEQEKENERYEKEDKGYAQAIESQRGFEKQSNAELDEATKELEGLKAERDELRKKHSSMKEKIEEEKKNVDAEHRQYGDDIQALKDKIASLEQTLGIKGLAASRKKKISSEVESLKKQLLDAQTKDEETLDKQLDIEKRKKYIESSIKSEESDIEERLKKSEKKVSESKSKVKSVQARLDEVVAKRDELTRKREDAGNTHSEKVGKLESDIASTNETIDKLNEALDFLRGFGQRGADATRADYRIERLRLADEEKSAKDNLENVEKYIAALKTIAETDTSKIPDNEAGDVLRIKNMANTALANLNTVKHYLENLQRLQAKPEQMEMDDSIFRRKKEDKKKKEEKKGFAEKIRNAKSVKDIRDASNEETNRRATIEPDERSKLFDIQKEIENEARNGNKFANEYIKINQSLDEVVSKIEELEQKGDVTEDEASLMIEKAENVARLTEESSKVSDANSYTSIEGVSDEAVKKLNTALEEMLRVHQENVRSTQGASNAGEGDMLNSVASDIVMGIQKLDGIDFGSGSSEQIAKIFGEAVKIMKDVHEGIVTNKSAVESLEKIKKAFESLKEEFLKKYNAEITDENGNKKIVSKSDIELLKDKGIDADSFVDGLVDEIENALNDLSPAGESSPMPSEKKNGQYDTGGQKAPNFSIGTETVVYNTELQDAKNAVYEHPMYKRLFKLGDSALEKLKIELNDTKFMLGDARNFILHIIDTISKISDRETSSDEIGVIELAQWVDVVKNYIAISNDNVSNDVSELEYGSSDFSKYNDSKHADVISELDNSGAHEFMRKGKLKQGSKVTFAIHPDFTFDGNGSIVRDGGGKPVLDDNGNVMLSSPVIWIVTGDVVEGANGTASRFSGYGHQILNVMDQTDYGSMSSEKKKLIDSIRGQFVKWYMETGGKGVFTYEYIDESPLVVDTVTKGVVPFSKDAKEEYDDSMNLNGLLRWDAERECYVDDSGNEVQFFNRRKDGTWQDTAGGDVQREDQYGYDSGGEESGRLLLGIRLPQFKGRVFLTAFNVLKRRVSSLSADEVAKIADTPFGSEIIKRLEGFMFNGVFPRLSELLYFRKGFSLKLDNNKITLVMNETTPVINNGREVSLVFTDKMRSNISEFMNETKRFINDMFDYSRTHDNAVEPSMHMDTLSKKPYLVEKVIGCGLFYCPKAIQGRIRPENVGFNIALTNAVEESEISIKQPENSKGNISSSGQDDANVRTTSDEEDKLNNDDSSAGSIEESDKSFVNGGESESESSVDSGAMDFGGNEFEDSFSSELSAIETEAGSGLGSMEDEHGRNNEFASEKSEVVEGDGSKKSVKKFSINKKNEAKNIVSRKKRLNPAEFKKAYRKMRDERSYAALKMKEMDKANMWMLENNKIVFDWEKMSVGERMRVLGEENQDDNMEFCGI